VELDRVFGEAFSREDPERVPDALLTIINPTTSTEGYGGARRGLLPVLGASDEMRGVWAVIGEVKGE
jgi:hypothetical protein